MNISTEQYNRMFNHTEIGNEKWWTGTVIPNGWVALTGILLNREEYKVLFDYAVANNLIVTEEEWQNNKLYGLFSYGTDETNFRIPDKRGLTHVCYEEGYHSRLGQYIQDQIVNFTGNIMFGGTEYLYQADGVFSSNGSGGAYGRGHENASVNPRVNFNASRVVKTGERVQVRAITAQRIIKYK